MEWLSKSESSSFVSAPSFSTAILAELSTFSFFWPSTVFDPVLIDLFLSDVWPEVVVLILLITFELSLFDDPFSVVGTLSEIAKALNARGIPTVRNGEWYPSTVRNYVNRCSVNVHL